MISRASGHGSPVQPVRSPRALGSDAWCGRALRPGRHPRGGSWQRPDHRQGIDQSSGIAEGLLAGLAIESLNPPVPRKSPVGVAPEPHPRPVASRRQSRTPAFETAHRRSGTRTREICRLGATPVSGGRASEQEGVKNHEANGHAPAKELSMGRLHQPLLGGQGNSDLRGRVSEELHGCRVWVDYENLSRGAKLSERIRADLRRSRLLIVLWSRAAKRSRWVTQELRAAASCGCQILPCILDRTPPDSNSLLAGRLYCDFSSSFMKGLSELVARSMRMKMCGGGHRRPHPTSRELAEGYPDVLSAIGIGQRQVLDALDAAKHRQAARTQARLNPIVGEDLERVSW